MTGFESVVVEAAIKGLATAIGKVAGESGINLVENSGEKFFDATGKLGKAAQNLLFPIARQYFRNYTKRHGILKVLGMDKPVSIESVYTGVKLLNPSELKNFASVEALELAFRKVSNRGRGFQSQKYEKESGIVVANREQYLMVLGAPGMGKTTFLRKVGLEALKRKRGSYEHDKISVLLELKTFRTGEIDIEKAIAQEFAICGLPEYAQLTEKFLEQGKLLILLDGLDEVPNERMTDMVTEIQNFVDRYSNNYFITSCRIAAYRNNFRRFTDVAIADFDDEQIKNFITNWFQINPDRAKECLTRLNSGDYQSAKELTRTPLLLTLVCILYQRSGQFPINRSTLYERALRVLLEEWNAAKEIQISKLYKGLDTKRKELILSQIAFDNFREDQLFFSKRSVVKQIEKLLPELLPNEQYVDGNHVLRDIEVQHGLLVERAESIYSFSHLTIQEFLTAQHIDYEDIPLEEIVDKYLCHPRWREVFLLLAGLKKADNLLLEIEKKIHSLMNTDKLKGLLLWTEKISNPNPGKFKPVGNRAISLAHAHAFSIAKSMCINGFIKYYSSHKISISSMVYSHYDARDCSYAYRLNISDANSIATSYSNNFEIKSLLVPTNNLGTGNWASHDSHAEGMINFIGIFLSDISWIEECQIYVDVNYSSIITKLEETKKIVLTSIDDNQQSIIGLSSLGDHIVTTLQDAFHLTSKLLYLSKEEFEILDDYFYANWLMIQCKQAAVSVTPEVWSTIETRMFLPV